MFTRIGHILPETVKKNGMAPKVARARVVSSFEEATQQLLSEEARGGFKVLHCVDGTLTVACRSAGVASELREHKQVLLETLKSTGAERLRFLLSPWR